MMEEERCERGMDDLIENGFFQMIKKIGRGKLCYWDKQKQEIKGVKVSRNIRSVLVTFLPLNFYFC